MGSGAVCPRGHALADDAVYCTVCWVRVVPEDPERVAQRRRRQRRIWFPLLGAGAVVLGIAIGGTLASSSGGSAMVVAAPAVTSPASTASAVAAPAPEPDAVAIEPLAATLAGGSACLPADTSAVTVRTRTSGAGDWTTIEADVVIGDQGPCSAGEVEVTVTPLDALPDQTALRLVARDANGERLAKVTIDGD